MLLGSISDISALNFVINCHGRTQFSSASEYVRHHMHYNNFGTIENKRESEKERERETERKRESENERER